VSETAASHRLDGLEPDNLLAFLALLGLLRALQHADEAQPARKFRPRVRWSVEQPPIRPVLVLAVPAGRDALCVTVSEAVGALAAAHDFGGRKDIDHTVDEARAMLVRARDAGHYAASIACALLSDAAIRREQGKFVDRVKATPFCLLGQGQTHFLEPLASVPQLPMPSVPAARRRAGADSTGGQALRQALFETWMRQDKTPSFRWDPMEDVRYALMYGDPQELKNKSGTQHGANRLAAIGLSTLTAAPRQEFGEVQLSVPGGGRDRDFTFAWPIWRDPISLPTVVALLSHPELRVSNALTHLGVSSVQEISRIWVNRYRNVTRGVPIGWA
jgi:hypothetical protein